MNPKKDSSILAKFLFVAAIISVGGCQLTTPSRENRNSSIPRTSQLIAPASASVLESTLDPYLTESGITPAETLSTVENIPAGAFAYGGSTTWAPIRRDIDSLISLVHPDFELTYTSPSTGSPGSGAGIRMLLNDQLAFAQSSRQLKPSEMEAAMQQGFSLREVPVALEGIAVVVHPDLNIDGLTTDQLRKIYIGQINNWNQVGGPNLSIDPYTRRPGSSGTVDFFVDEIMEGADFTQSAFFVGTTTEALRSLSTDLAGIYYGSAAEVVDQCTVKPLAIGHTSETLVTLHQTPLVQPSICPSQRNQVNPDVLADETYPLTRQLWVIIKENGQVEQRAGEAYVDLMLSQEGQKFLETSGFVRVIQ
ncbi:MAG: PstS family phosphate ABC transporter substrate-binding protein [Cyanobacteria bacterium P01_E01_bin.6]